MNIEFIFPEPKTFLEIDTILIVFVIICCFIMGLIMLVLTANDMLKSKILARRYKTVESRSTKSSSRTRDECVPLSAIAVGKIGELAWSTMCGAYDSDIMPLPATMPKVKEGFMLIMILTYAKDNSRQTLNASTPPLYKVAMDELDHGGPKGSYFRADLYKIHEKDFDRCVGSDPDDLCESEEW